MMNEEQDIPPIQEIRTALNEFEQGVNDAIGEPIASLKEWQNLITHQVSIRDFDDLIDNSIQNKNEVIRDLVGPVESVTAENIIQAIGRKTAMPDRPIFDNFRL